MATWILVADRCSARILEQRPGRPLLRRHELLHPQGRMRNHDHDSDRPGNVSKPAEGAFHAMGREQDSTEREAANFARRIQDLLHMARTRGDFDKLILVAEAGFLGILRQCLDAPLLKLVQSSYDRNLTQVPDRDIEQALGEATLKGEMHAPR